MLPDIANSTDNHYGEADKEFHRIIALSANNPVVEGMIQSLLITHAKIDSQIPYRERDVTAEKGRLAPPEVHRHTKITPHNLASAS